jgi:hypothetical protein
MQVVNSKFILKISIAKCAMNCKEHKEVFAHFAFPLAPFAIHAYINCEAITKALLLY